jgi:hypothetical protein
MTDYDKKEFLSEVLYFFEEAKNEQGDPVPYSEEGVVEVLDRQGWEYIKKHWFNAMEDDDSAKQSIDILFEFHHQVVLKEVTDVALELEKEGKLVSGVGEDGEITFQAPKE